MIEIMREKIFTVFFFYPSPDAIASITLTTEEIYIINTLLCHQKTKFDGVYLRILMLVQKFIIFSVSSGDGLAGAHGPRRHRFKQCDIKSCIEVSRIHYNSRPKLFNLSIPLELLTRESISNVLVYTVSQLKSIYLPCFHTLIQKCTKITRFLHFVFFRRTTTRRVV